MQSKLSSFIEAMFNTGVGLLIAFFIQTMLFHVYGIKASTAQSLAVVFWMTLLSIARSYLLRRFFNWVERQGGYVVWTIGPVIVLYCRFNQAELNWRPWKRLRCEWDRHWWRQSNVRMMLGVCAYYYGKTRQSVFECYKSVDRGSN